MGSGKLTLDMIDDVLPTPHDEVLTRLIGQLADHDAAGALVSLDQCLAAGYSLERLAESLAEQIRTLMLLAVCGPDTPLVDLPSGAAEAMLAMSKRFDAEHYVYMISVLEELRRTVRVSALGRAVLEAGVVRLASAVRYRSIQSLLDQLGGAAVAAPEDPSKKKVAPSDELTAAMPTPPTPAQPPAPRPPAPTFARGGSGGATTPPPPAAQPRPAAYAPARPASSAPNSPTAPKPAKPAPAAPPPSNPSTDELRAAATDPTVRAAMDLFGGSLVNVEQVRTGRE
jgi:DNA polymerase III gamma/tau subunit